MPVDKRSRSRGDSAAGSASQPSPVVRTPRRESSALAINVDVEPIDVDGHDEQVNVKENWILSDGYWVCKTCHPKAPTLNDTKFKCKKEGVDVYHGRMLKSTPNRTLKDHNDACSKKLVKPSPRKLLEYEKPAAKGAAGLRMTMQLRDEAWACAIVFSDLSYRQLECPYFTGALQYTKPKSRLAAKGAVLALYNKVLAKMANDIHGKAVLLCLDGGTCNRTTLINFTVCPVSDIAHKSHSERNVRFLSSAAVPNGSADEIRIAINGAKAKLEAMGAICVGACAENASAMAAAPREDIELPGHEEATPETDDEDEEERSVDELFDFSLVEQPPDAAADAELFDEEDANEENPGFFVHIRCWCQTFQLVVGDIAGLPQLDPGMNLMKTILGLSRGERKILQDQAIAAGMTRTRLVQPACTRWNSYTRAAFRILELHDVIVRLHPTKVKPGEWFSLRLFVAVTAPLAWATDKLQADDATIETAREMMRKVREALDDIDTEAVKIRKLQVQSAVQSVVQHARQRLSLREEAYLTNDVTRLLALLDHRTSAMNADDEDWVVDMLQRWCVTTKCDGASVKDEVKQFRTRNFQLRSLEEEEFWSKSQFTCVGQIRSQLMNIIASEASVERSFQVQDSKWTKLRNRASVETIEKEVFIRMNYEATVPKVKRQGRREDIDVEEWTKLVATIGEEEHVGRRQTRAQARPNPEALRDGSAVWLTCTAVNETTDEERLVKVRGVVSVTEEIDRQALWAATPPASRGPKPRGRAFCVTVGIPRTGDELTIQEFTECRLLNKRVNFDPERDPWQFR